MYISRYQKRTLLTVQYSKGYVSQTFFFIEIFNCFFSTEFLCISRNIVLQKICFHHPFRTPTSIILYIRYCSVLVHYVFFSHFYFCLIAFSSRLRTHGLSVNDIMDILEDDDDLDVEAIYVNPPQEDESDGYDISDDEEGEAESLNRNMLQVNRIIISS